MALRVVWKLLPLLLLVTPWDGQGEGGVPGTRTGSGGRGEGGVGRASADWAASHLQLLTLPTSSLLSSPPPSLASPPPPFISRPLDAPIVRLTTSQSDSAAAHTAFTSVSDLPLLLTHTAGGCCFVHRILATSPVNSAALHSPSSEDSPSSSTLPSTFTLLLLDCLRPCSPLLCIAPNIRLCSSNYCEVAGVDVQGRLYLWQMDMGGTVEEEEGEEEGDRGGDEALQQRGRERLLSSSSISSPPVQRVAPHRRLRVFERLAYDWPSSRRRPPSSPSSPPPLSFARCCFASHPRHLLVAFTDRLLQVDLTGLSLLPSSDDVNGGATDDPSAAPSPSTIPSALLPLPPFLASSLPVNRPPRRAPPRPQLMRDHFFRYQRYRHSYPTPRATTGEEDGGEALPSQEGTMEEEERETAFLGLPPERSHEGEGRVKAERSGRRKVNAPKAEEQMEDEERPEKGEGWYGEGGRVLGLCEVREWPHVVVVLTSSFLLVLDTRHSSQPLHEWQLPTPLHRACQVSAIRLSSQALLISVWAEWGEDVTLYCCTRTSSTGSPTVVAAFAPLRLPSFSRWPLTAMTSFSLLPLCVPSLVGLSFLVDSPSVPTGLAGATSLPPFTALHLSSAATHGAVVWQQWRAPVIAGDGWTVTAPHEGPHPSFPTALFPSDAHPPAWLSTAGPCDKVDLTPLFKGLHTATDSAALLTPSTTQHTQPSTRLTSQCAALCGLCSDVCGVAVLYGSPFPSAAGPELPPFPVCAMHTLCPSPHSAVPPSCVLSFCVAPQVLRRWGLRHCGRPRSPSTGKPPSTCFVKGLTHLLRRRSTAWPAPNSGRSQPKEWGRTRTRKRVGARERGGEVSDS